VSHFIGPSFLGFSNPVDSVKYFSALYVEFEEGAKAELLAVIST
jgi:hypothetical protein